LFFNSVIGKKLEKKNRFKKKKKKKKD